jgi:hypothetical protein
MGVVGVEVEAGLGQDGADDGAVGAVFGEGLAGPPSGDEDAAAAEAEVFAVVCLGRAVAGHIPAVAPLGCTP